MSIRDQIPLDADQAKRLLIGHALALVDQAMTSASTLIMMAMRGALESWPDPTSWPVTRESVAREVERIAASAGSCRVDLVPDFAPAHDRYADAVGAILGLMLEAKRTRVEVFTKLDLLPLERVATPATSLAQEANMVNIALANMGVVEPGNPEGGAR